MSGVLLGMSGTQNIRKTESVFSERSLRLQWRINRKYYHFAMLRIWISVRILRTAERTLHSEHDYRQ